VSALNAAGGGPQLVLNATLTHPGFVGVNVAGPVGVSVQISEQTASRLTPVATLVLSSGTADLPRALKWSCQVRQRELVAQTLPPAAPQTAYAKVQTPSCSNRLAVAITARARVGQKLTIRLRDRWGIGAIPVKICVSAPGARNACSSWWLRTGEQRRVIRLPAPRPGGWRVTVANRYGRAAHRLVWVTHAGGRIRLLAAGDSEMQILDDFLGQSLGAHGVNVTNDARISTGLTNSFFFDWQSHARQQAATLKPDVTVMFMGANDGFAVPGPHGQVQCCGRGWSVGYANLVAQMMSTYLRGSAGRVYWVELPVPRPGNFKALFGAVNAGIRGAARRFPGRVALIDAASFFTPGGAYRDFMSYHGQGFAIHEPDGIHLSIASDRVALQLIVRQLLRDRVIR